MEETANGMSELTADEIDAVSGGGLWDTLTGIVAGWAGEKVLDAASDYVTSGQYAKDQTTAVQNSLDTGGGLFGHYNGY